MAKLIVNESVSYGDCVVYNTLSAKYTILNIGLLAGIEKAKEIRAKCDEGGDFNSIFKVAQFVCILRFEAATGHLSMSFFDFSGIHDNALDRQLDQIDNGWTIEKRTQFAGIAHDIINNPPSDPVSLELIELSNEDKLELLGF